MTMVVRRLRPHFNSGSAVIMVLFGLAAYWTMYTFAVYDIATQFIVSSPTQPSTPPYWFYTWSGTLFPWPSVSGIMSRPTPWGSVLSPSDRFIYLYLFKTGALVVICVTLWILGFFSLILYAFRWMNESLYKRLTAEKPARVASPLKPTTSTAKLPEDCRPPSPQNLIYEI